MTDFKQIIRDMPGENEKIYSKQMEYLSDVLGWFGKNKAALKIALRYADEYYELKGQIATLRELREYDRQKIEELEKR